MNLAQHDSLDQAFAQLRQMGYFAHRDLACCSQHAEEKVKTVLHKVRLFNIPVPRGAVFCTEDQSLLEAGTGLLVIYFGRMGAEDDQGVRVFTSPITAFEIATEVLTVFHHNGLAATWSGNTTDCILVYFNQDLLGVH